jgi:hypothetical protein
MRRNPPKWFASFLILSVALLVVPIFAPAWGAQPDIDRAMKILSGQPGWVDGTPLLRQSRNPGVDSVLSGVSKGFRPPIRKALAPPTHKDFWILDLTDFGGPDFNMNEDKYLTPATLAQTTSTAYLYIEDGLSIPSSAITQLMAAWESDIYPGVTGLWGDPPDELDGDPHIYLLIARFQAALLTGGTVVGFFDDANEYTDTESMSLGLGHSNEIEMMYINSDFVTLDLFGDLDPQVPGLLAHEFQHIIHWKLDPDEDLWLNEGHSDVAMIVADWADVLTDHIASFSMIPTTGLMNWDNRLEDYGATAYFFIYLHDHYGGDAAIAEIASDDINGVTAVDTYLRVNYGTNFRKVFRDWTLANMLSEATGPYSYQFQYDPKWFEEQYGGLGLPIFYTWRDEPLNSPSPPALPYLEEWAAEYFLFKRQPGEVGLPFHISFDAQDGSPFIPSVVGLNASTITRTSLNPFVLDNTYAGDYDIPISEERVCLLLRHETPDYLTYGMSTADYDLGSFSGSATNLTDSTAPGQVTDLTVDAVDGTRVYLSWTTPGDDGTTGLAYYYDIRASTAGTITAGNWSSAFPVRNVPLPGPSGQTQSFPALDLDPSQAHWFALRTYDELDNESALSNNVTATTGVPDTTAPGQILDLAVIESNLSEIILEWTAPGDDGSTGTAARYELRYAQFAIDGTNFRNAAIYPEIQNPSPAGATETVSLPRGLFDYGWSFTIRTFDEENNVSPFSNLVYEDAVTGVGAWERVYR